MGSENIFFNEIPGNIKVPSSNSEFDYSNAKRGVPGNPQKAAIIGQMTSEGEGIANTAYRIRSEENSITIGGTGSVIHLATIAAYKSNKLLDLTIVPVADGVGNAAVGTITVANVPTTPGQYRIWIANEFVDVAVDKDDAVNDIAINIKEAINLKEDKMPIQATVATAIVTLTARNKGLLGNNIPVAYLNTGVKTTTLTVVQPTGGTVDPDITNALLAIEPTHYIKIQSCNNDATNLGLLKDHVVEVSKPVEKRFAMGVFGYTGIQATIETLCGTTLDEGRLSCAYKKYTKTSERGHSLDYELAAAYMSKWCQFQDPARPLNHEVLVGIAPASESNDFSWTQKQSLLTNGVTPIANTTGNQVEIVRAVTTATTNDVGIKTDVKLDVTTITSSDFGAVATNTKQQTVYRGANGKAITGIDGNIRDLVISVARDLETARIYRNVEDNLDGFIVEEDNTNVGQYNCEIPTPVVPGLHVFANKHIVILN